MSARPPDLRGAVDLAPAARRVAREKLAPDDGATPCEVCALLDATGDALAEAQRVGATTITLPVDVLAALANGTAQLHLATGDCARALRFGAWLAVALFADPAGEGSP